MPSNLNRIVQPECGAPNPLVAAAQQISMRPSASSSSSSSSSSHLKHSQPAQRISPNVVAQLTNNLTNDFISSARADQLQAWVAPQVATAGPPSRNLAKFGQSRLGTSNNSSAAQMVSGAFGSAAHDPLHRRLLTGHQGQLGGGGGGKLATDFLAEQELVSELSKLQTKQHQEPPAVAETATATATASPTITTAATAAAAIATPTNTQESSTKPMEPVARAADDDLAFWQNLSQKYIGPSTSETGELAAKLEFSEPHSDSVANARELMRGPLIPAQVEYVFDERNPLKEQFADPFSEGLKKLDEGDIPSAVLLFEAAVQKEPENSLAWRYLGTTQAQNEKDKAAIIALQQCLNLDPADQSARLAISVCLGNECRQAETCRHLLEWLIRHEKYGPALGVSLAEFHHFDSELSDDPFYVNSISDKHYKYVRDKLVAAARMSPQNPDAQVQGSLGVLFNMRGEFERAVDCFKAVLSVRPADAIMWNRLGAALANGNKSHEAVVAYRKALELAPGFLRSRYNLAIALIQLSTYDEAAKQLVQILNMQAAGKGSQDPKFRARTVTSAAIWNTLRTVATLLNKPQWYPMIDGRDLASCNAEVLKVRAASGAPFSSSSGSVGGAALADPTRAAPASSSSAAATKSN